MNDETPSTKPSDELVGELLDNETASQEQAELAADLDRQRIARLLFVDSLLDRIYRGPARIEDSVLRALAAIDTETSPAVPLQRPRLSRRRWLFSTLSIAASVVGVGLAMWLTFATGGGNAHAAVKEALRDASRPVDREYRVLIDANGPLYAIASAAQSTPGPLRATLYVQGDRKFALRHPPLLGKVAGRDLWLGCNGRQVWLAPAIGPVFVSNDLSLLDQWTMQEGVRMPFTQITAALTRLSHDYDLTMLAPEILPGQGDIRWNHVRGQRREPATLMPAVIDVWSNPTTGTVCRLILDWKRPATEIGPRRIDLELVSEQPLHDDWYDPGFRNDGSRRVIDR